MPADFGNLRVLSLESRRSREMAQLITNHGGQPTVVASTREVASGPNPEEAAFAAGLLEGRFPVVIFMTGVGTRALARAMEPFFMRDQFVAALSKVPVLARGGFALATSESVTRALPAATLCACTLLVGMGLMIARSRSGSFERSAS